MLPLRLWIKVLWGASGALGLVLALTVYLVFFTRPSQASEPLPDVEKKESAEKRTEYRSLDFYSDAWKSQFNTNPPPKEPDKPKVPPNFLQQLLSRHVNIKQIITDDFAIVIVDGVEQLVEPRKKTNEKDVVKRWLMTLEGRQFVILKILPGKGIKFDCNGQEVWLESKEEVVKPASNQTGSNNPGPNPNVTANNQTNPSNAPEQQGDRWVITAQEGNELAQRYDEYIQELSPEATEMGLKIRRVNENSKARQYGLQANDIVSSINNVPIRSLSQIPDFIRKNQRQKQVAVDIIRNGQKVRLTFQIR